MFGYPTDVLDPSGSETTSVYANGQLTSQTVAGATTTYAYDSDKLVEVVHPGGNVEWNCYRTGPNCETTTPLKNQLQWKVITDSRSHLINPARG